MKKKMTRRRFIGGTAAALAGSALVAPTGCAPAAAKRWYKGNLHAHSLWSDGRAFPEEAVAWYKSRGWHFLGLSDHNVFQDNPQRWVSVLPDTDKKGYLKRSVLEAYRKAYPQAETRTDEKGNVQVRLKTFGELSRQFNVPGEFLLVPDVEATRFVSLPDGRGHAVHMNYVNLPALLPSYREKDFKGTIRDASVSQALAAHVKETARLAQALKRPYLFILNHPIWTWYDIGPEAVIDNPEIRYFELCNGGSPYGPGKGLPQDGFDTDRLWDVVNAFRARRGQPLLYGVGTDDTHAYHGQNWPMCVPGNAWSLVRAASLDADALIAAMDAGDFVTCEGLEPQDVAFDAKTGTLRVSVAAAPDAARTVRFIVSKKNFSEKPVDTVKVLPDNPKADKKRFLRTINVYESERIGCVAKTVEGRPGEALEASYTLGPDDLYVRARIEQKGTPVCKAALHPQGVWVAWTQPYRRG